MSSVVGPNCCCSCVGVSQWWKFGRALGVELIEVEFELLLLLGGALQLHQDVIEREAVRHRATIVGGVGRGADVSRERDHVLEIDGFGDDGARRGTLSKAERCGEDQGCDEGSVQDGRETMVEHSSPCMRTGMRRIENAENWGRRCAGPTFLPLLRESGLELSWSIARAAEGGNHCASAAANEGTGRGLGWKWRSFATPACHTIKLCVEDGAPGVFRHERRTNTGASPLRSGRWCCPLLRSR